MSQSARTKDDIVDEFMNAAWQNDTDVIDTLSAQNPWLVDPAEPYLQQALNSACNACQALTARQLVEKYHADVNKISEDGMNPLHEAMNSADMETAKMLIRNGANVNTPAQTTDGFVDGWTPLHFAISHGNADMTLFLLSHGADPKIADKEGLDAAAFARSEERENLASIVEKFKPAGDPPKTAPAPKNGGPKI